MKKKIFKIAGIVLLLFVGILVTAPFFLRGKIAEIIKNKVNNSVNASLDFSDADLSLFSSFPNAKVSLQDISLVNKTPFAGDTLFTSKEVDLEMSIKELFKDASEPINIKSLKINGAHLGILVDKEERANYDIAKPSATTTEAQETSSGFTLSLQSYEIVNSKITYDDASSGIHLKILEMNHQGKGDLSLETSELDTHTDALVSFTMDSTNYLNKNRIKLDALIGIDLKKNKYSFLKNEALVNQLPLVFDGYVQVNDDNEAVAIRFKTPSSDFKNFLAVIPEAYSKNIENVKTTGNFTVAGEFTGVVDDTHIPKFTIKINSDNASFKYPDLPKSVTNIVIDAMVKNTTGITEDTFVDVEKASFRIDGDQFDLNAHIKDLMGNTKVRAHVDGKMDMANISQAYPVSSDLNLKGLLALDVNTAFDMNSIENKQYGNTKTNGNLSLKNFEYTSDDLANPVSINTAEVTFNPKTVHLDKFEGKMGTTDFAVKGTIDNLLGYLFNDEKLEGNFNLQSNRFVLNDFMDKEAPSKSPDKKEAPEESLKIPSFLDCTMDAKANTVVYDNLILKEVSGKLTIKDQKAVLSDMDSKIFDGILKINGEVSTKNDSPTFAMNLGMNSIKIGETFQALELFKVLAPVAKALRGTLNSTIGISGNLNQNLTPNLTTISGNVLAELLQTELDPKREKLLSALSSKMDFIEPEQLNLKGLKTVFSFDNGVVKIKPFTINYQDIAINVAGSHTFDSQLNYKATLQVPAKYLGKEVTNLIAKIDDASLDSLTIPVTAAIGGDYANPTVSTDLTGGIKNLTAQLVEIEKQKLIGKGKDKAKELIGGILKKNEGSADSTQQKDATNNAIKGVLGGILGTKSQKQDTVKTDTTSKTKKEDEKKAVKDILGGLFGKKKKDTAN